jgi:hypothetical protein
MLFLIFSEEIVATVLAASGYISCIAFARALNSGAGMSSVRGIVSLHDVERPDSRVRQY